MSWIARHIEIPKRIFFYIPQKVTDKDVFLQVISKKENIKPGDTYEFVIPSTKGVEKYIGTVKELKDDVVVITIKGETPAQRKFSRILLKNIIIPVGIFIENFEKPFTGILKDFSLGGFRAQFSTADFFNFEKLYTGIRGTPMAKAIFRFPNLSETYEVDIVPVRFNHIDHSVGFSFTFNTKNERVLKIYEKIMEEQSRQS